MCNGYYQKLKTGTYSIDAFYSKRYKRTVPFFALLILLNCVTEFTPKTVCEGLMEITMLFGFLPNNTLSTIGVAWTLGAIFAFYIIFPFIVFLLYSPKRGIVSFVISLVITYMCQCYFMTERFVTENFVMRHSFLYCLPYFLIGGIVYLYKDEIERFVNQFKVISFCVVLALTVGYYITPDVINSINIVVIKTLILYTGWLGLALGYDNRLMNNKFTNYISNLSMEIIKNNFIIKMNNFLPINQEYKAYYADKSALLEYELNTLPCSSFAPGQLGASFSLVLPMSLPPDVAKGMIVLPFKS